MPYQEDEMLMLSGAQHYVFCPRQWALIHLEQLWHDNHLTTEGSILHKNVDNPDYRVKNNDSILLRRVSLISYDLGLYGVADAIELIPTTDKSKSITYKKYPGYYMPMPIEYKHGKPKKGLCDITQLVCQVMCIEEMYNISLDTAALFYWETRHRLEVTITDALRQYAKNISQEMHSIANSGKLPKTGKTPKCKNCSLLDVCFPEIGNRFDVENYLSQNLYAQTP